MVSRSTARTLRRVGALLMVVVAGVHFQQYVDFMSEVPTVGVLFLLNAAGGAGLLFALLSRDRLISALAMSGSLALALGSLVSIGIALGGSFFGYQEPTLRLPIVIAIVSEALLIGVLIAPLIRSVRTG
ncbi:MAG TPA: hypothetical protein VG165_07670 [Solirubrobacteraceae bacterium]|jgi:hypothetical protein|nr:hypothetical protein [Solirubrobacteraceae bacterium]